MDAQQRKVARAGRRRYRVRKAIHGTATKPRLSVFRSHQEIYAQLIDDDKEVTLVAAASNAKDLKLPYGGGVSAATQVGKSLAEKAKAKGITEAAYDRGSYRFHGRVKALARAATEAGLKCTGLEDVVKKKADAPKAELKAKKVKQPAKA